jgi:hypothetical protein
MLDLAIAAAAVVPQVASLQDSQQPLLTLPHYTPTAAAVAAPSSSNSSRT